MGNALAIEFDPM